MRHMGDIGAVDNSASRDWPMGLTQGRDGEMTEYGEKDLPRGL